MKKLFQISLLLWLVSPVAGQEPAQPQERTLRVYDWKELKAQFPSGEIFSRDGTSILKIKNTNGTPLEVSLLIIANSSIIKKADTVSCEIKWENVGIGRVEHTNLFRSFETSISSSLQLLNQIPPYASGGDERTNTSRFDFAGTVNWQRYDLNVDRTEVEGLPTQLELKLFLPTNGTVYLRPVKLLRVVTGWWSPQQIGLIGGIGGSVIGCLGALLGLLASKGKARNFVLTTMKIFIALGILLTIAGFVAVVSSQPYAVWYALLLPGVILTLVFSLNLPSIQRRYDELEIRRMTSVDAMGS